MTSFRSPHTVGQLTMVGVRRKECDSPTKLEKRDANKMLQEDHILSREDCAPERFVKQNVRETKQGGAIRKESKLTLVQREVLVGILLGDASLRTDTGGRRYRLQVSQSEQHKQYLFHLYDIYKNLTTSPPIRLLFSDSRNPGKTYVRWTFSTTQQACFRFYGQQFYDNHGKRKCPRLIEKLLSPRSIAHWYMDDGAQKWKGKSRGVRFCTDNFSHIECQWLVAALQRKYGLKATLQKKGHGYRIYISSHSYTKLKEILFSFLIPNMVYKFPE